MKTCTRCNQEKPETEFHKSSTKANKLRAHCKVCVKEYDHGWYQNNKKLVQKHAANHRKRMRKRILEVKRTLSCRFCDEDEPICLDFHHPDPSTKNFAISDAVNHGFGWNTILEEIDKCICVCRNCHAKIHADTKFGSVAEMD